MTRITAPAGVWLAALDSAAAHCGDATRTVLTGVRLRVRGGVLDATGADRYALCQVRADVEAEDGEWLIAARKSYDADDAPFKALIAALRVAERAERKVPGSVAIDFGEREAVAYVGANTVTVPLLDARYPTADDLIPPSEATTFEGGRIAFNPTLLGRTMNVAAKYGSTEVVRMRFSADKAPARLDWEGNGWTATAAIAPMFFDWEAEA